MPSPSELESKRKSYERAVRRYVVDEAAIAEVLAQTAIAGLG